MNRLFLTACAISLHFVSVIFSECCAQTPAVVTEPKVLNIMELAKPHLAPSGLSGLHFACVSFFVLENGDTRDFRFVAGSSSQLELPALALAKTAKAKPGTINQKETGLLYTMSFTFADSTLLKTLPHPLVVADIDSLPMVQNYSEAKRNIQYLPEMIEKSITGQIKFRVLVNESGLPVSIFVQKASHPYFLHAISMYWTSLTFKPAIKSGKKVMAWADVPLVRFNVTSGIPKK